MNVTVLVSVQLKDQSLANCTIDDRSLAVYVIKASDCTNKSMILHTLYFLYFASMGSFGTIFYHVLSKYDYLMSKTFNRRCFSSLQTCFIYVYNFKNHLSDK